MKNLATEKFSIALFISAVSASALTMLLLLWHFPVVTATTALFIVAGAVILARFAKTIELNPGNDVQDSHTA